MPKPTKAPRMARERAEAAAAAPVKARVSEPACESTPVCERAGVSAHSDADSAAAEGAAGAAAAAAHSSSSSTAAGTGGVAASSDMTWSSLGLHSALQDAIARIGWATPTPIQTAALPVAMDGKDVIALAATGSGKTAAFALPILHSLLTSEGAAASKIYALILSPTRELAFQISETCEALGSAIGLRTCVLVGGVDSMSQAIALAKKPHIVVGTPGRVLDHLQNTKGFSLRSIRYLVLDEADRMLSLDFEEAINGILSALPRDRRTYLFSATMTSKVAKLQRASLRDPVRVEVSTKYGTVDTLVQQYLLVPAKYKDAYAVYVLNEFSGSTAIVFASTCASAQKLTFILTNLGFGAVCLHGQMTQPKRLAALARFKEGHKSVLVATDVASRGLDIPCVDLVLNYDVPANAKDYIHRVGRTARAGRGGRAVTIITQYDIEMYQRIEALLGKKLDGFPAVEDAALLLVPRVAEAQRVATADMRESGLATDKDADADDVSADPTLMLAGKKRRRPGHGRH